MMLAAQVKHTGSIHTRQGAIEHIERRDTCADNLEYQRHQCVQPVSGRVQTRMGQVPTMPRQLLQKYFRHHAVHAVWGVLLHVSREIWPGRDPVLASAPSSPAVPLRLLREELEANF